MFYSSFILNDIFRNSSGRGHRRLRLCSKKNYERKKYASKALKDVTNVTEDGMEEPVPTLAILNTKLQLLRSLNGKMYKP